MKRFGQSAIATPANAVTIARMIVAVPTLWVMYDRGSGWLSFGLWVLITASDSLDGWLARRDGATRSGAFLDPVTDKAIVLGGLAVLAARGDIWWWPVIVITVRELGISLYRSVAGRRGIVLPALMLGKRKAFLQYCSVGVVLLPLTADAVGFQQAVLIAATALTVISALQILQRGYVDWQRRD
jgi:CDP-diacylglycerol--glycerol-3-phosphate 3-phosphatidyltransferase